MTETTIDAQRKRRGPGRGDTRQELLEVAAQLFETHGYRGTSIRDIARATDTSISNIYHHFGNKEGLWREIRESSVRKLPGLLRAAVRDETDPKRRLRKLLLAHLGAADEYRRESRIFFVNGQGADPGRNKANRDLQREILDIYLGELELLQRHGLVRSAHLKILAFNILGALNWMLRWFRPQGELSAAQVHEEIVNFALRGVGIED